MNEDTKLLIAVLEDYKKKYSLRILLKILLNWVELSIDNTLGL